MTRVNGRALEDYKDFEVLETGLAVPQAEPLYVRSVQNGYPPEDLILDTYLAFYAPLYLLKGSKFKSVDRIKHTCSVTGALWRPNHRYFDGSDDKINCGNDTGLQITGALTVACWAKGGASSETIRFILSKCTVSSQRGYLLYVTVGTGYPCIYITSNGSSATKWARHGSVSILDDAWHFILAQFTPSVALNMFIDDTLRNGGTEGSAIASIHNSTSDVNIGFGDKGDSGKYWDGEIGECFIFNRVIGAAERTYLYNVTKWRYV